MTSVAPREQIDAARRARQLLAKYNKARDLIQLGAYAEGRDAELDAAVRLHLPLAALLQQDMHERASIDDSWLDLRTLVGC